MAFWNRSSADPEKLESRLTQVESELRRLKVEWVEILDKILHAADRMNKRQAKLVNFSEAKNDGSEADLTTSEGIYARAKQIGII